MPLTTDLLPDRLAIEMSPGSTITIRRTSESVTVRLGFGRSNIGPDVSVQPGAVTTIIDQQARLARDDPAAWRGAVAVALRRWEPDLGWCPDDGAHLSAALGALTHPLLATLYRAGGEAIDDIPRWASPVLRNVDPRSAARVLTGGTTTRRLTRSLASSLLPVDGRIHLAPLALVIAARRRLGPDHLANVLDGCTELLRNAGGGAVPVPSVDDVRAIEAGLAEYPADRCVSLLVDATDRSIRLAHALRQLAWVVDRVTPPLPRRVVDLEALCERTVPIVAIERPRPATSGNREHTADELPGHLVGRRRAVLPAPAAERSSATRWPIPSALVPVAGLERDGLRLLVPTSTPVLNQWAAALQNCLGTYGPAVAQQRAWLIGIHRSEQLIGCIEIDPATRRIRQAHGRLNRMLPRPVLARVSTMLREHRILA
ncbi:MAG: hypothetical protein ACO4AY_09785 [Ilumatobacteraceae bacterium]